MNSKQVIGGGVLAGFVFYVISLAVWALFKFLPVVPLSIAVPSSRLGSGWQVEHLLISIVIGILWAVGYAVYGKARPGGWLYGLILYLVAVFPAFILHFATALDGRSGVFYGAFLSLIGALLGGKVISLVAKK